MRRRILLEVFGLKLEYRANHPTRYKYHLSYILTNDGDTFCARYENFETANAALRHFTQILVDCECVRDAYAN